MKVSDVVKALQLSVISGAEGLEKTVSGGYVSDLLSDVMGNARTTNVWITLHTHKNVIAVASLKDISAVIIVKGLVPSEDTVNQSNVEKIPILGTTMETYEVAGKLYNLLK